MGISTRKKARSEIVYPETDGKPMAENTLQYQWIVTIKEGLEWVFHDRANVFIAADLFWYPVEGHPKTVQAPDALVAFGRPKGHRRSYLQWLEGGIAPQVVWEILSPGNRTREMRQKFEFYDRYEVEEYYIYDPDKVVLDGYLRIDGKLTKIREIDGWTSPRLGIRFDMSGPELVIYGPDGERFRTVQEIATERAEAISERAQIAAERDQAIADRERLERIIAQMRQGGSSHRSDPIPARSRPEVTSTSSGSRTDKARSCRGRGGRGRRHCRCRWR